MARLTQAQVTSYASAAGFQGRDLDISVAVAHAESQFNPQAHNAMPPDNSYGLWQINMIGALGPARRKAFNLSNNEALYDPATNARVAYAIYKQRGGKFTDWTTYTGGIYKRYLTNAGDAGPVDSDKDIRKANEETYGVTSNSIPDLLRSGIETFRQTGLTWLAVLIGLVLLVIGVLIFVRGGAKNVAHDVLKAKGVL